MLKSIIIILSTLKLIYNISIHIIPHSHMDPGWGMTIENYYSERTRKIYTSVYKSLLNDERRTFVICEIIFFKIWYEEQSKEIQKTFKKLVENKQVEFVGGGFVQNDEANTRYHEMLLNLRLGNQFIEKEFGIKPIVGWQLDPFGHSSSMAYIYQQLNYKYVVLDRIDLLLLKNKIDNVNLEFIYKPFDNVFKKSILYHVCPHHYGNPVCNYCLNENKVQSTDKTEKVLKNNSDYFINELIKIYKNSNTNNIMHLIGGDFKYKVENYAFERTQIMCDYINSNNYTINNKKVKMFFSTPSKYFESLEKEDIKTGNIKLFTEKNNDLFPLASEEYCLWTGYFTSRPYLKGIIETTTNTLISSSLILSKFILSNKKFISNLYDLKWVTVLNLHHDAITGTSNQRVSTDFISKSSKRIKESFGFLKKMFLDNYNINFKEICIGNHKADFGCNTLFQTNQIGKEIYLSIINPMLEGRLLIVIEMERIFHKLEVNNLESDFYCINEQKFGYGNKCFLSFFYDFDSLNLVTTIKINKLEKPSDESIKMENKILTIMKNEYLVNSLIFNPTESSFQLNMINNQNYSFSLTHSLYYGYGFKSNSSIRNNTNLDGLYIFAPSNYYPNKINISIEYSSFYKGKISTSLIIRYENLTYMIITIFKYPFFFKIDSIIDPYTKRNSYNFVLHLQSTLDNNFNNTENPEFWTDSNSMKMMRRIKDYNYHNISNFKLHEKVANNFFPITRVISIREKSINDYSEDPHENLSEKDKILSLYVDRPESGGCLRKGEIMLLIQRNSLFDDNKGIGTSNYENESCQIYFRVTHFLMFGNSIFYHDKYGIDTQKFMNNYFHSSFFFGQTTRDFSIINELKESFILSKNINCFFDIIHEKLIIVQFYFDYDYYFTNSYNIEGGVVTIAFNKLMIKNIRFDGTGILCEDGGKKFLSTNVEKSFRLNKNGFLFVYFDLI